MSIKTRRQSAGRLVPHCISAVLVFLAGGCSHPAPMGEVEGVLMINGKPGEDVQIQFIPEGAGSSQPASGQTDSSGRFTLATWDRESEQVRPGAVVATHRVVLSDNRLAKSATGRGVPIRFGPEYTLLGSTPILQEVKEGKQNLEIRIP